MARKNGPSIVQEELYPPPAPPVREEIDDARLLDLDVEQESPFLRGQKRVPVRRGSLPKKTASRISWVIAAVCVLLLCGARAMPMSAAPARLRHARSGRSLCECASRK